VSAGASTLPAGETIWRPPADAREQTRLGRYTAWLERERGLRLASYEELWRWSIDELEDFWGSIWDHFEVAASTAPRAVLGRAEMPGAEWFPGARLNYAEAALRPGADADPAVFARSQTRADRTLTRGELRAAVAQAQAGLARLGVGPGSRVAGYLPNIPEAVIAFLAAAGLGATWCVCPPEFGAEAALNRLGQFAPEVLLAVDGYRWGEKTIDRRAEVARIAADLPHLAATIHVPYLHPEAPPPAGAIAWEDLLGAPAAEPRFEQVPFDHPLWVLFSSGTTGPPKAFVHGHGGMVIENLKGLGLHHDLGPGDSMFFYSTTGWMVWNQVVSALLLGASIVLLDGDPMYPGADALWRLAGDSGITHFGASASFMMLCADAGMDPAATADLSRIRFLKSAGSPLPSAGYRWLGRAFPGVFISSSSGGTEVCTGFVGGVTTLPVTAGEMAGRWLGVAAEAWDVAGEPVVGEPGELVIRRPMPSMPLRMLGDRDFARYREEYFSTYPGAWRHGDWFVISERGTCAILGRSDATLNRGGVRLGTGEFYEVLERLPQVAEALVVHLEDEESDGLGELLLLVGLAPAVADDEDLRRAIRAELRRELSPRHVPDTIVVVPAVPSGKTGKRLEVPVKRILLGARPESVLTPADVHPGTLAVLEAMARERRERKADVPD
jgi:acetoacetyl-CoA synthetase